MPARSRLWTTLIFVWLLTAVTACASLGPAGEGAVSANLEIEQMQNKIVLLNIARASLRRPPIYTTLSSVAGKVRPTGGVSLTIPFGPNLSAGGTGVAAFSAQANDAPTVTLSPLETQEFYQGIMSPIKKETIDFYVQQGFSRALLFNLFFSRIEVQTEGDPKIDVFRNYPGKDDDLVPFQRTVNQLINDGLTTESVSSKPTPYGPLRTADEVKELDAVANAAKSELVITEVAPCALEAVDWISLIQRRKVAGPRDPKQTVKAHAKLKVECGKFDNKPTHDIVLSHFSGAPISFYRVEKPGGKATARLCFAETSVDKALRCKEKPKSPALAATDDSGRIVVESDATAGKPKRTYAFVLRSTDAVLYYLGEVARRQLYPDPFDGKTPVARTVAFHYARGSKLPVTSCWERAEKTDDPPCYPILTVREGGVEDAFVRVDYDGRSYAVPARYGETVDRSSQVFAIVTQLLALHKSAKDMPQTSILQVVNP